MIRLLLSLTMIFFSAVVSAQEGPFDFGKITREELSMSTYPADTTAGAVVLREYGEAFISDIGYDLIFTYHVKIKILKQSGFDEANFVFPLRQNENRQETIHSFEASTFNLDPSGIKETKIEKKAFFIEKTTKDYSLVKFTLPDIRVGSVMEITYIIDSPFKFNFHTWEFQSNIPKIQSEYKTTIPGVWQYNVLLRGFLKLTNHESSIARECFRTNGNTANCVRDVYFMQNIPAFKEEEFMTAKSNYLSAIYFELAETRWFDGTVNKHTRDWKDVDEEFRQHDRFGKQIRKARNIDDLTLKILVAGEPDSLKKAIIIYKYVQNWYSWDGSQGMFADSESKKAYDAKKGNVGDINLSLIGQLQSFGFDADPVISSTRLNGVVTELYPVITQFNYVMARVVIKGKAYLLDATDSFLSFGMLPVKCINGKGRLISKEKSSWVELKPFEKSRTVATIALKLTESGKLQGTIMIQSQGFDALNKRKEILRKADQAEYVKSLERQWDNAEISGYSVENLKDVDKMLVEKMDIVMAGFDVPDARILYFNPFLFEHVENNPFKSADRFYPVDMVAAKEVTTILSVELPPSFHVDEAPANVGLQLPQGGGKFLVSISNLPQKIAMTSVIAFNKAIYSAEEYHSLKEFYARVIQTHQGQFVLKRN